PHDAQRRGVVDGNAPFEVVTEKKTIRPEGDASDRPQITFLAPTLPNPPIDHAILEFIERELEMPRRAPPTPAAQRRTPVLMHPFEVHRIDGVLLALEPIARNLGNH